MENVPAIPIPAETPPQTAARICIESPCETEERN